MKLKKGGIIGILSIFSSVLFAVWDLLVYWLSIFSAPLHEYKMLWIIIPIWVNWFFTEFFVEKYGTNFGNAVTNGVIPIFASIDWSKYLFSLMEEGIIRLTFGTYLKFFLCIMVFIYGLLVIALGIKLKRIIFYVGRIRWITYVLLVVTPIIYNVIKFNYYTMLAIIVFFPLYWWIIELFDRITPEPRVYKESA